MGRRKHISTRERAHLFALHDGVCHICGAKIDGIREGWDIEHVIPFAMGGEDDDENRQPAHRRCHRDKTRDDFGAIAKAKRREARHTGAKAPTRRPIPGSRNTPWRQKLNRQTERRTR